ncbi:MAG: hypothetical protein PHG36_06435, partial [Dehalococcoidia bacterium]|nr:hypothetical protein [Dehalococcoidia bacterium]
MAILILRPNGDNSAGCNQQRSSGSYNYACVDEAVYDNTDYNCVSTTISPRRDHYDLPNHSSESGIINKVTVKATAAYTPPGSGSGSGTLTLSVRVNSTDYDDSGHSLSASQVEYSHDWPVNPATGNAWTWAEIDALIPGDNLEASGYYQYYDEKNNVVTVYTYSYDYQFYVEVDFTPSSNVNIDAPCAASSSQAFAPSITVEVSASCAASSSQAYAPLVGQGIAVSPPVASSSSQS